MQPSIFDQQPAAGQVVLNAPAAAQPRRRLFYYDGQFFSDPGPEYTVAQVMAELARTYPELANGTWHNRVINDHGAEVEEITFVKVTGEKGSLTARQVADGLLTGVTPRPLGFVELTNRLNTLLADGQLNAYQLLELSPQIEAALGDAERVARQSQGMVLRCLDSDTRAVDPRAPGLLKPWAFLTRLRPAALQAVATRRLQAQHRLARALRLVETHFPGQVKQYRRLAGVAWWEVLARQLNLVEENNWFQLNWAALNRAWDYLQAENSDHGERLAAYLDYMPVMLYGFGPGRPIHDFPPLELLRVLLHDDPEAVRHEVVASIEIDVDVWSLADRRAAWERLYAIDADPGRYPEPARWLPELARWACGATGNVILDQPFHPERQGPWYGWPIADTFRVAWRRAGPVIRQSERLLVWSKYPDNLAVLAEFLAGHGSYHQLDW